MDRSDYDIPLISDSPTDFNFETVTVPPDNPSENGFDGWYVLEGANGEQKSEMFHLNVEFEDVDSDNSGKLTVHAGVFSPFEEIGDQGYVEDSWAKINTREAIFKTKSINGFVYSFSGTFFKNKTTGNNGEKLLRGTFMTFKKGKIVRKAMGDFSYYEPHCWH